MLFLLFFLQSLLRVASKLANLELRMVLRCTLGLALIVTSGAQAALRAELSRAQISPEETVTLQLTSDQPSNERPDFSALEVYFEIIQQGKSTQVSIINGQKSLQTIWQLELLAKIEGEIQIPSFELAGDHSAPITLQVKARDPANGQTAATDPNNDEVQVQLEASTLTPYVQQNFYLTLRLLYAAQLSSGELLEPKVAGLQIESMGEEQRYRRQIAGKTYQVIERQYRAYAEKSGKIQLPSVRFTGIQESSSFGFGRRGERVIRQSSMLDINVQAAPSDAIVNPWLVGVLAWSQTITDAAGKKIEKADQQTSFRVGEPITRSITLRGVDLGAEQLPDLDFSTLTSAKVYTDKVERQESFDGSHWISEKTWRLMILPQQAGDLTIPALSVSYFDPENKTVRQAILAAQTWSILPAINTTATMPASPPAATSVAESRDNNAQINGEKSERLASTTVAREIAPTSTGWHWLSAILSVFLLISLGGIGFYRQRYLRTQKSLQNAIQPVNSFRSQNAQIVQLPEAKRHLQDALVALKQGEGSLSAVQQAILQLYNANQIANNTPSQRVSYFTELLTRNSELQTVLQPIQQALQTQFAAPSRAAKDRAGQLQPHSQGRQGLQSLDEQCLIAACCQPPDTAASLLPPLYRLE